MFQVLNPTWLFAIAALSVPVLIHLWNVRPGKTLKVGSIVLIEASLRKSSRSFSLMDILLLLLRCLFLLALAFLLAGPYWLEVVKPGKLNGWLLIPRQNIHQVYSRFKPKIDSLTKAGYQLHYFNTGFAPVDTTQLKNLPDSVKSSTIKNWILLKQLSEHIPAALPVYVFMPNLLNAIDGAKPGLALNLHLQTYTPADSVSKWIQGAAIASTDNSIKITEGNSGPLGTTFTNSMVAGQHNSPYQVTITNGQALVNFKGDTVNKAIVVDTATLRIAIYGDKNTKDAGYLQAALDAVKQFTDSKISIQVINNDVPVPAKADWIFWLRERRLPLAIGENVSHVFVYEPGKAEAVRSWIDIPGKEKIALAKHIAAKNRDEIFWADGFGNPVLSMETRKQQTKLYSFYSRFNPAWNDLVWSNAFPEMMLKLLIDPVRDNNYDKRIVDDKQLLPRLNDDKTTITHNNPGNQTDLSKALWLLLILLFFIERWLAHRTKSTDNYG